MLNEFLGTTNDFFAELNWNKFIKSIHYITGTCTLVFFLKEDHVIWGRLSLSMTEKFSYTKMGTIILAHDL